MKCLVGSLSYTGNSLVNKLFFHGKQKSDDEAFIFLNEKGEQAHSLSFNSLMVRASQDAVIWRKYACKGDRVVLCFSPGLEFIQAFYGCLLAGLVAVPIYPPRLKERKTRLQSIVSDCGARLFICDRASKAYGDSMSLALDVEVLLYENLALEARAVQQKEFLEEDLQQDDLAFLQYTSGSTGQPKGVMVSHGNISANLQALCDGAQVIEADIFVNWLPLFHDLGLVNTVLLPVFLGAKSVLMSPASFVQRPEVWLQAISRFRGTVCGAPNFAYNLCVNKIDLENCKNLDLSCWDIAFNAAEPISAKTIDAFCQRFSEIRFNRRAVYPSYGMAEATVFVSGGKRKAEPLIEFAEKIFTEKKNTNSLSQSGRALVACGYASAGHELRVVDPHTLQPVEEGSVGEIWFTGPSVAQGYWNNPELTEDIFHAKFAGDNRSWLRTGDLGVFHADQIYVTGRIKELIIINGQNYYPADIERIIQAQEAALQSHGGAAFSLVEESGERLVVVQEVKRTALKTFNSMAIFELARQALLDELQISLSELVLIEPASLKKTSSGKVQRSRMKNLYEARELKVLAHLRAVDHLFSEAGMMQDEPLLSRLAYVFKRLTGLDAINPDAEFSEFGFESLMVTELLIGLQKVTSTNLTYSDIYKHSTLTRLASHIETLQRDGGANDPYPEIERKQQHGEGDLSLSQNRIAFFAFNESESFAYNENRAVFLPVEIDLDKLVASLNQNLCAHEIFCSRYREVQGEYKVFFQLDKPPKTQIIQLSDLEDFSGLIEKQAKAPFNLVQDSLVRVDIFVKGEVRVLSVTAHHLVADGLSLAVFFENVSQSYAAGTETNSLPDAGLKIQYFDYARWQRAWLNESRLQQELSFWKGVYQDAPLSHGLKLDGVRAQSSLKGQKFSQLITGKKLDDLRRYYKQSRVSAFSFFKSLLAILVHRFSADQCLVIGFPVSGRLHPQAQDLVGSFMNTLAVKHEFSQGVRVKDFIHTTNNKVIEALDHQAVPFDFVVNAINPARRDKLNPLFQIMITLLNEEHSVVNLGHLELKETYLSPVNIKQDLELLILDKGQEVYIEWRYNASLFEASTIVRLAEAYMDVLGQVIANDEALVEELAVVSPQQKYRLFHMVNDTRATDFLSADFSELFSENIKKYPTKIAVSSDSGSLTYAELDQRSDDFLRFVKQANLKKGSKLVICAERSTDTFAILLACLKSGICYVPVDPAYPAARIQFVVDEVQPELILCDQEYRDIFSSQPQSRLVDMKTVWAKAAQFENGSKGHEESNAPGFKASNSDLAYILFTSGSTGKPKGVMIEQGALVNFLLAMKQALPVSDEDVFLSLTTLAFDISVLEIYLPLLLGASTHIIPQNYTSDPRYILEQIKNQKVSLVQATPATWQMLLTTETNILHNTKLLTGGEALSRDLAQKLLHTSTAVWNVYGPTETTVWSAINKVRHAEEHAFLGKPLANTELYVLNDALSLQPSGVAGELYIGGAGLARGYLNRPDLSAEKFVAHPFSDEAGARLYRTGDLVRWLPEGQIEFLGRVDHQVKLRGFRIELGEIENQLNRLADIRECVVLCREDSGHDKRLVAYVVPADALEGEDEERLGEEKLARVSAWMEALKGQLPHYMVPGIYVFMDKLPLSPNGKVDRKKLPAPGEGDLQKQQYVAPRNEAEAQLCAIWQEVLGLEQVSIHDDFFALGGHSLLATRLISLVRERLQRELPLRILFEEPTVAGFAGQLASGEESRLPAIEALDDSASRVLSHAQQRLWFIDRMDEGSAQYNMPAAFRLKGQLNIPAFERAMQSLLARHDILRSGFRDQDGEALSFLHANPDLPLLWVDLSAQSPAEQQRSIHTLQREDAARPFDLEKGLLLRLHLVHLAPEEHILLFNLHHIIFDGWSTAILVREFSALYSAFVNQQADPLPPLRIQYADYAAWQRQWLQGATLGTQLAYWKTRLDGLPQVHNLPLDFPRPQRQQYRGLRHRQRLSAEQTRGLRVLCQRYNVTLFMLLQSAFSLLLSRYSGERDIVIGSAIAGRVHQDVENLIGFFVNTLVLRSDLSENLAFSDFLARNRQNLLDAYAYQHIPFEMLVDELNPQRSLAHSPLVQVCLNLQNQARERLTLPGLALESLPQEASSIKFDLEVDVYEDGEGIDIEWGYNSALFKGARIARMADSFGILLDSILAQPEAPLFSLELLSARDRQHLLVELNNTARDHDRSLCIQQLIEARVEEGGDALAVVCGQDSLSYAELNRRSNQLARHLIKRGVKPDQLVGLCMARSCDLIVGMLGILKSGAAYLPLDPAYPEERLRHMLSDSQVQSVVSQRAYDSLPALQDCERLLLDEESLQLQLLQEKESNLLPRDLGLYARHLAYSIYTSGSTGLPKGVMIEHRNLLNLCHWAKDGFRLSQRSRVVQFAVMNFDASVLECMMSLSSGATLYICPDDYRKSAEHLTPYLVKNLITHAIILPSLLAHLDHTADYSLEVIITAGEAIDPSIATLWSQKYALFNGYGPSECTVCTHGSWLKPDTGVTIGKAIANTRTYVLDEYGQLTPHGTPGELCVGGEGVFRGYLGQSALSALKTLANVFDGSQDRIYRTGDLVRYNEHDELEFLGRIDHQVKLRGFRIELGEIENQLNRLADIRECVVLCREDSGHDKRLVAYVVPADALEGEDEERLGEEKLARVSAWMEALKGQLPHYMVPGIYVFMDKLPLSPNGKVDRKKLPAPGEGDLQKQQYVAPRNEAEAQLCAIWQEVLGVSEIGIDDNFFALGGDSIISIQVVSRAKRHCLELTVRDIFEHQTIARLSPGLKYSAKREIDQAPTAGAQLLLPIQAFFFEQAFANPQHFNQAVLLHSPAGLDRQALRTVLAALYVRHDVLRLRFSDGKANYLPYSEALLAQSLDEVALAEQEDITAVCDEVQAGLNISEGPVFRARLMTLEDGSARLLLVAHHLVIDGVSWRILLSDLDTAWRAVETGQAPVLASKTDSYQAWAAALHDYAASDALASEKAYWLDQLKASAPGLATHPEGQPASSCKLHLDETTTSLLLSEANQAYRTQVQELLLAALLQAWQDWAGHKHLRVELEGHGRETAILRDALDVSETVGWFTSHYPLMLQAESDDPAAVIKSVKESVRAVPARGIGFGLLRYLKKDGDILQALGAQRPTITFNYLGQFDNTVYHASGFKLASENSGRNSALENKGLSDLSLDVLVHDGQLHVTVSCAENTIDKDALKAFAECFDFALRDVVRLGQSTPYEISAADFELARLSDAALDKLQKTHPELEDIYPTTALQTGMIFHGLMDGSGASYTEQIICELEGELNEKHFLASWQKVVARNDVLRTCFFGLAEEQIHQVVLRDVEMPVQVLDWRTKSPDSIKIDLDVFAAQDKARGFDFEQAPLTRLALIRAPHSVYYLVLTHHHAILDGWSIPLIFNEFLSLYKNEDSKLSSAPGFKHFIAWLQTQDQYAASNFWARYLEGCSGSLKPGIENLLIDDYPEGARRVTQVFDETLMCNIQALLQETGLTLNIIFQFAWALVLKRYSGEDDIVFGTPVSGRPASLSGVEEMVGLFINTIPARVYFENDATVGQIFSRLKQENISREEFSYAGLQDILNAAGLPAGTELFSTLLTFENYPQTISVNTDLGTTFNVNQVQTRGQANYALTAIIRTQPEVSINIDYQTSQYSAQTIRSVSEHFTQVLSQIVERGLTTRVADLEIVTAAERQLFARWNNTARTYPQGRCLHEYIEDFATRQPEALALRCGEDTLSFGELDAEANRVANYLIQQGVQPDDLVGLCIERSLAMYIGLLGIMKAGAAYVPLDPSYPQERLDYMLEDSAVKLVVTESHLLSLLDLSDIHVLLLDDGMRQAMLARFPEDKPLVPGLSDQNLLYVIYTSGSTGQPKGVLVQHNTVMNFLHCSVEHFLPEHIAGALVSAPLAFDGTVCTLYTSLLAGKYVELLPSADTDIDQLADYIFKGEDNLLIKLTPSHLDAMLKLKGLQPHPEIAHLFVVAGEQLTEKTLRPWRDSLLPGCCFINEYGPTEASVGTTIYHSQKDSGRSAVPIGAGLANTELYVLNDALSLQPSGVAGELYIGGAGLARGYLNRPDLSAEKFVAHPFSDEAGARLYRTGDLVRWLPEGQIEFLGRVDHQVKLRGFRIELGEIENQLNRLADIRECVVLCREDSGHDKRLVAYVVPADALEGEDEERLGEEKLARVSAWMEALKGQLPHYMVPGIYVFMDKLPLSPNGKVDRKKLPAPGEGDLQKQQYVAPRNEAEAQLCAIWQEVLGLEQVSIHDDFFALGGHSLLATRLISLVRERLQREIPLRVLFDHPSVADFYQVVETMNSLSGMQSESQEENIMEGEI